MYLFMLPVYVQYTKTFKKVKGESENFFDFIRRKKSRRTGRQLLSLCGCFSRFRRLAQQTGFLIPTPGIGQNPMGVEAVKNRAFDAK